jgi:hypothetical protein
MLKTVSLSCRQAHKSVCHIFTLIILMNKILKSAEVLMNKILKLEEVYAKAFHCIVFYHGSLLYKLPSSMAFPL